MRPAGSFALALFAAASFLYEALRPRPVPTPPVRYFDDKCARCHGTVESPDNSAFEHALGDEELEDVVKRMCDGPAQAPLEGASLRALTALVRARQKGNPFVCWTRIDGRTLGGETVPGTSLSAKVGGQPIAVQASGNQWSLQLPPGTRPDQTVITATLGDTTLTLDLAKASFTN